MLNAWRSIEVIIKELKLGSFGKFQDKEISLEPGFNIIYGKNEAGKSTIHNFIKGMLFGLERSRGRISKDDPYLKNLPWDNSGSYGGSMDIAVGTRNYRIIRSFHKNDRSFKIIDLATGREVKAEQGDISDIVTGLTESIYRNTVSVEQLKAKTDEELVEEVRNYIANLTLSKTNEVDVKSALNSLSQKKKQLQTEYRELNTSQLSEEISKLQNSLGKIDSLTQVLKEYELREKVLRKNKDELQQDEVYRRDLNGTQTFQYMKEKYDHYKDLKSHYVEGMDKIQEREKKIRELEKVQTTYKSIYTDMEKISELYQRKLQLDEQVQFIRKKEEELTNYSRKKNWVQCFIPVIVVVLLSTLIMIAGATSIGATLAVASAFVGIIVYLYKQYKLGEEIRTLEYEESLIEKEFLKNEALQKDILLKNNVTTDSELRFRIQVVKHNEEELIQLKEELKYLVLEKEKSKDKIQKLSEQLHEYISYYFDSYSLEEDNIQDVEYEVNYRQLRAQKQMESIEEEYESLIVKLEKIKWELAGYDSVEEELEKKVALYQEYEERSQRVKKDLEALDLAISSIEALSMDIHDTFGNQINEYMCQTVERITKGKYRDVKVDENLDIKLLRKDDYVNFEQLSAGAIAQMYVALRVVLGGLLTRTKGLPFIFDDSFVLYDDERLESVIKELNLLSDRQIIIFTCHNREKEVFDKLKISYHYVELSNEDLRDGLS